MSITAGRIGMASDTGKPTTNMILAALLDEAADLAGDINLYVHGYAADVMFRQVARQLREAAERDMKQ